MKKTFVLAAALLSISMLLSGAALADSNSDGYRDADVAVVKQIISQSPTLTSKLDADDPADWSNQGLVVWGGPPQSVTSLSGENLCTDFSGELDISALSSLETLIMPNNPNLTGITLPDNHSNFNYLNISNTGISNLDVSAYPNLEILYASDTNLSALEVSACTKLKALSAVHTNLTALDVSKNINLEALYVTGTNLTGLDLSKNTALQELHVSETNLTELDISNNPNLTRLTLPNTITKLITARGTLDLSEPGIVLASYDPVTGVVVLFADGGIGYVEFILSGDTAPSLSTLPSLPAYGSTAGDVAAPPQTGDRSSLPLSFALLLGSFSLLVLLRRRAKA